MQAFYNLLSTIWQFLVNRWLFIHRHAIAWRIAFLFSLTVASVKAAVRLFGFVFTRLGNILVLANTTGTGIASGHSGIGIPIFDKANAVLPVAETLAFFSAYIGVMLATTGYMAVRSAYKAIPLKAT